MNEFFKRILDTIKGVWSKWKTTQRIIFFAIIGVVILAIILLFSFSAGPNMVSIINKPITDAELMDKITNRLEIEGLKYTITADNRLMAPDDKTAKKAKAILAREDLIPTGTDPWAIFDTEKWTLTDFERNVNLRRAMTDQLQQHIEALDDIDSAQVVLQVPEKQLFSEDQDPVTASVIISPHPGSDIETNRKKVEGIEKLIKLGVPGLKSENIVITDLSGLQLNDWTGLADATELGIKERELKIRHQEEAKYIKTISTALAKSFGEDRVNILNVDVNLDMGNRTSQATVITPIETVPDNPLTPYSERQFVLNVPVSEKQDNESFKGSGWNPEGPAGQEGQTPPAYKDQSGLVGEYNRTGNTTNYELNKTQSNEKGQPEIKKLSIAVQIDGTWKKVYDDKGQLQRNTDGSIKRDYIPLTRDELSSATKLVQNAVGYNPIRGDTVAVENLRFDRTKEQAKEDDELRKAEQTQQIVLFTLLTVAAILVAFIIFRLVSREIERRRRLREEELARQHQAMREAALRSAEEETTEVEMSVEERARLELQEHAVNMAREHPEDVAQLIRTWLLEE